MYRWLTEANTAVDAPCVARGRCPTTFVGPLNMAASFNASSWRLKGDVLSTELRALFNVWPTLTSDPYSDHAVGLTGFGPNINLIKDPRYGRNSELPSEDPYLAGAYASAMVGGMQQTRAGPGGEPIFRMRSYLKHFTAYSVEANRFTFAANLSAYDLHDSNLPQFATGLREGGASGVMCSYFAPNGTSACGNKHLLTGLIRTAWARADAVVMSDCGAVNNMRTNPMQLSAPQASAQALEAGLDVYGGWYDNLWGSGELHKALAAGLTSTARLDAAVGRTLRHKFSLGLFDAPALNPWSSLGLADVNASSAQRAAYDAALQGMVLLVNRGGALPLVSNDALVVVGPMGSNASLYRSDYAGAGVPDHSPSILSALRALNGAAARTRFEAGVELDGDNATGIPAARQAVASADAVVICVGISRAQEHETHSRQHTQLPGLQEHFALEMIEAASAHAPVVVLLVNGGIVSIDGILGALKGRSAAAVVEAFNPMQQGALALAAQLFGHENRWGKLPVTIYPAAYAGTRDITDMTFVNRSYRYYTGTPLFPFGHGLSLTPFEHRECACTGTAASTLHCGCTVANRGEGRSGDEVLLVFHRVGQAIRRRIGDAHPVPRRRLVAFERVSLAPRAETALRLDIARESLALTGTWGAPTVYAGLHELIFSRGHAGDEAIVTVPVD